MAIYIVPPQGDFETLTERCTRAGVPLETTRTAAQFVIATMGKSTVVVAAEELTMSLMANHAPQFFDQEMPLVLHDVPGLVYSPSWMRHAAIFPVAGFSEFERITQKSGVTGFDPKAASSRNARKVEEHSLDTFNRVLNGASMPHASPPVAPTDPALDDEFEG